MYRVVQEGKYGSIFEFHFHSIGKLHTQGIGDILMDRHQKKNEKRKKKKRPCPRLSPPVSRGKPAVRGRNLLCGWGGGGAKQGKTSFTAATAATAAAAAVVLNHQLSERPSPSLLLPFPFSLSPPWLAPSHRQLPAPTLPKPYPANSSFRASILEWRSSSSTRSLIIMFDVSNLTSLPSSVCLFF